jgi:hypothetical protein
MEHRWGERFNVDIAVRLATRPFAVRTGRLADISLSGACIRVPFDLRLLTRVQVAFVLPQRFAHATPVISAYVARRSKDGIGVEWCEFAPQAVVELLRSAGAHRPERRRGTPAAPAPDDADAPALDSGALSLHGG